MADNTTLPPTGTGTADIKVATDAVTYSGDAGQNVQLMRSVLVTGSEGSKTVVDPDMNSGNKSAATLRVVLATDQPALTNALLITGSGTAGTAASGVQTVQGIASMTPVQVSQATAGNLNCTEASAAAIKTAVEIIDNPVKVDDAGFTVASDSIMMAGNLAVAVGSDPDTADANDAVVGLANRHRVPFTIGGHPNTLTLKHTSITNAVTNDPIITISTGNKIVVTRLSITLDNASTVFPTVLIGFGTASTPTTTAVLYAHGGFPAGGGMTIGSGSGILGIGADDADLRVTTTGNATGNGLQIVVSYFLLPS